jgi:hypothetical protein
MQAESIRDGPFARFLIARSTPWCIPGFIASTVVAEPRRITRLNADGGNGVAHLLLAAPHIVPVFNAHVAGCLCSSARWGRSAHLRACAPIANASVIAKMSAVRISASPVFLRLRTRATVNQCADEERRELLRRIGGTLRLRSARTGKQQSFLKKLAAQKIRSHFFWNLASLAAGRVRVIRELMTVQNGGCHESIRSRSNDVRYSPGVFSY